ncbi:hypothetical protein PanNE5_03530 [Pandoraea sp. NE5]|uniref:HNH endonuclease signature motif containing protein n=1 Tax=Pandoraea sp. NE5 TaxID=2904129 RepID=UPI0021C48D9D|nr:HNH endonuclease signature motif containing protein [Pandoraea sp. NE5]BDD90913.1 hypothetical protein PanNE5_03530 [Pandoraea sp. NE5]
MTAHKPWSDEEKALLTKLYPDRTAADVALLLGRPVSQIYCTAARLGVKKSAEFFVSAESGRTDGTRGKSSRFVKGQTSWNKGVLGICGTHPNSRRTQFKKGEMHGAAQHNYVPIGSHRVSKDGYLERKVTDDHPVPARRWVAVHRLVWEEAHGPVPSGHVICFLPGRRSADLDAITLDALELVSRADLARRNHPRSHSPELAGLVQLKGAITRHVNRIAREAKESQS